MIYYPVIPANVQHSTWLGEPASAASGGSRAAGERPGELPTELHVSPYAARQAQGGAEPLPYKGSACIYLFAARKRYPQNENTC